MRNLLVTFLCVITLTTTQSLTAQTVDFNQKRSITLQVVIDERTLGKANELAAFAEVSDEPIDILISSPGGVISHGLYFIQSMKAAQAKGIKVRCYVSTLAASMAYTIFTQCSERYALPYSTLLFHAPRISGNFLITPPVAARLAQGLSDIEQTLLEIVLPVMGVTEEVGLQWFSEAYIDERLFVAADLLAESPVKWFTVVGKIDNCPDQSVDPYSEPKAKENKKRRQRADYVYIKK